MNNGGNQKFRGNCFKCGKPGHIARSCQPREHFGRKNRNFRNRKFQNWNFQNNQNDDVNAQQNFGNRNFNQNRNFRPQNRNFNRNQYQRNNNNHNDGTLEKQAKLESQMNKLISEGLDIRPFVQPMGFQNKNQGRDDQWHQYSQNNQGRMNRNNNNSRGNLQENQ